MKSARLLILLLLATCLTIVACILNLRSIPTRNTDVARFDAIIVLGCPANLDGTPSPQQRERVLEGVREYTAGIVSRLIMTGGAAHNQFVEADVMAALALRQGVPASAIFEEPQALNTIQNIFYSSEIMRAHNWHSAEIVSSRAHLNRAAMILAAFRHSQPALAFDWSTRAAPWPAEFGLVHRAAIDALEASRCLYIRLFGLPHSRLLPASHSEARDNS